MDTESMIENAVAGYQTKITNLQAQRTKYEWKQDAYRSIINKMVNFSEKYTSYTSSTNLLSTSFFNKAIKVTTNGAAASKVSATGRSTSDVQIDSVTQLASTARYIADTSGLGYTGTSGEFALSDTVEKGAIQGSISLTYGTKTVKLTFDENDLINSADDMVDLINKKLADKTITYDSGKQVKANEVIQATNDNGTIKFSELGSLGNGVSISSTTGNLKEIGVDPSTDTKAFTFKDLSAGNTKQVSKQELLSEKGLTITLDGKTKTIKGPTAEELGGDTSTANYMKLLQEKIDDAFGKNKLTVTNASTDSSKIALSFSTSQTTSSFKVTSAAGDDVGLGGTLSNYVDSSGTIAQLLGTNLTDAMKSGNQDEDGKDLYALKINNKTFEFTADTSLDDVLAKINDDDSIGVSVSYSQTTKKFVFTADETGTSGEIKIEQGGLGAALFGATVKADGSFIDDVDDKGNPIYSEGQDAKFTATVNGVQVELTRSSNTVDIDGLSVTLKDKFDGSDGPVTFTTTSDADTIVNAIKAMVEDYNTMANEIKNAYSTMPLQQSDGSSYEPLSDDDIADMSDSAVERYEEKAKTGLLFGDSDLSSLYNGLVSTISSATAGSKTMSEIGIGTAYSSGVTTLTLDETKLRQALESDPDKVRDAFTNTSGSGLMKGLSTVVSRYAATTGATKGILIQKAGSTLAPTSIYSNTWQSAIDDLDDEISKWQDRMSDKVDYYTTQFTNLETLIAQMNSQSSMLSSLGA
jgi:flagellar hook-associated protein 2